MSTRTINISLLEQIPQARVLRFTPDLASVDGDVLLQKQYKVTTDEDGIATIALPVKATGSLKYNYKIPRDGGKSIGTFYLSAGSAIDLDDLIVAGGVATDSTIDYINERLATQGPDVFDIRDYGAAVDGVTDDTDAVQDAIQAAIAAGGGTIFFPPGTTRIATGTPQVVVPANVFGHYVFEGVGSNSRIWIDEMGYYPAISLANIRTATVRDLVIHGTQDNVAENTGQGIIQFATCGLATFERVGFYGLAAAGTEGVVYCYNSAIRFQDCFFGGCVSPSAAVVNVPNCSSFVWENNTITDYGYLDGVGYNKPSVYGNTQHWIKVIAVDGVPLNGMVNPAWSVRNSRFDENTSDCLVSFSSTRSVNDQSLIMENCSFNGGFANKPSIKVTGLKTARFTDIWAGYYVPSSNPTFSSIIAHNTTNVLIDGLIHGTNNVDVQLTGTTSKLYKRRWTNATLTNTAGAAVDSD